MPTPETTRVGRHVLPVIPQKHARLRHRLHASDFEKIMSGEYSHHSYRVLGVLIPALLEVMPEHEWDGYPTKEAQERGEYNEDLDPSPTTAEIVGAFEKSLTVSGAGRLGKLLDLIKMGQSMTQVQTEETPSEPPTLESPDTPGESGVST